MIIIDVLISVRVEMYWSGMGAATKMIMFIVVYGVYTVIWAFICIYCLLVVESYRSKIRGASE